MTRKGDPTIALETVVGSHIFRASTSHTPLSYSIAVVCFTVFNCFRPFVQCSNEIRLVVGVGGRASARYEGVIFYLYKEENVIKRYIIWGSYCE